MIKSLFPSIVILFIFLYLCSGFGQGMLPNFPPKQFNWFHRLKQRDIKFHAPVVSRVIFIMHATLLLGGRIRFDGHEKLGIALSIGSKRHPN